MIYLNRYLLLINLWLFDGFLLERIECVTHWKVTESGRIESKEDSIFTLLRPYDLAAFIKQADRLKRLNLLRDILQSKEFSTKKDNTKSTPVSVASYQENFYKNDPDCIKAGQQLTKFSFYETHFITWRSEGMHLPHEVMEIKESDVKTFKKPFCDFVDLPFSMKTFYHLESIQSMTNITMLPETELLSNLIVDSEDFYGHLVHKSLIINSTSWVYLTMAADYFRIKADYANSIKCLQRAIHFSPRRFQNIPMLSLSNMLHKLHFINDSLTIALSSISLDSNNVLFSYYIGNIYVTLGELDQAFIWYEKAANIDPNFKQAMLKKHAVACHMKLELYLEDQHVNLQKKLDELKDYQSYSDEWFQLNTKLELEKSSSNRKTYTKNIYVEFLTNSKSIVCDWIKENNEIKLNCIKIPMHYTYFPFNNQSILSDYLNTTNLNTQIKHGTMKKSIGQKELNYCVKNENKLGCEKKKPTSAPIQLSTANYEDESDNKSSKTKLFPAASQLSLNHFYETDVELLLTHKKVKNKIYPPNSKNSLGLKTL